MNKINKHIKIAELIARKISNEITPTQEEQLNSWIDESDRNEPLIERISDWENFQERNKTFESVDSILAWNSFSKRIRPKSPKVRTISVLKYAAAIAIPLLLGGLFYHYIFDNNVVQNQQVVSTICPGSQNAVIILDDGRTIDLEDKPINELVEKDGSVINNKNGEISYKTSKTKKHEKPLMNTLIVPKGGEYNLVLADGSRVFLNSVSKLVYPVAFSGNTREVTLVGEGYFEVSKNANKPFIVNSNGMKIEVLGTSFNIKAYADEDNVFATLVEGKIKLNADNNENEWVLSPNEQGILNKISNKVITQKVDAQQFISWKNGVYTFANQPLSEIMKTLSRWYNFDYQFLDPALEEIKFDGGLNKYDDIEPILDIMRSTGKVKIRVEGKQISFM